MADGGDAISEDGEKSKKPRPKRTATSAFGDKATDLKKVKSFQPIFYDETNECKMEYFVLADLELEDNESNQKKRINDVKLGIILTSLKLSAGIIRIKRIGFRRSKIQFSTAKQANLVLKSKDLTKHSLRVFVPISFTQKFGVIRDVPKSLSEAEIKENLISDIPISSVTRFTRRNPDDEENRTSTYSVKIGFYGSNIPESVTLFLSVRKVSYYIPPPKQCFQCGRLGHIKKVCKTRKQRCLNCGREDACNPPCQEKEKKCLLCGSSDHNCLAVSKVCPKKEEQSKINKIMTMGNLSYNEVKEQYSTNSFEQLEDLDYEIEFPQLTKKNTRTLDNQKEINKTITEKYKYNQVSKQIRIPQQKPLIQGKAINVESQSAFSIPFEKVTEYEKLMNQIITGLIKTAEEQNNKEIKDNLQKCRQIINQTSILCDRAVLETASGKSNNGETTAI